MKRFAKFLMLLIVVGACLMAVACPPKSVFFGTWGRSDIFFTEAITIAATVLSISYTDDMEQTSTLDATVDEHDETAGTVMATVTGTTGSYFSSYLAGYVMYWLLAINSSGQLFHLYNINSSYPTGDPESIGTGPYDKQ